VKRAFALLFGLGAIATLLSFPFPPPPVPLLLAWIAVAAIVLAGVYARGRVGLDVRPTLARLLAAFPIGLVLGGMTLALLPLAGLQSRIIAEGAIPLWKRFVIAFDSAILEELVFRLFIMTVVAWALSHVGRASARPTLERHPHCGDRVRRGASESLDRDGARDHRRSDDRQRSHRHRAGHHLSQVGHRGRDRRALRRRRRRARHRPVSVRVKGNEMKIDLTGKTALVTGASRGIGEAIARRLGEAGAHVLVAARSLDRVNQIASEIGSATGVELDISGADVRDRIGALLKERPIDILVNNAGITDDDLFIRMKADAWTNVLRTNLDSAFHITQEVVKKMLRARWGRVINISSIVGMMGNPGQVNYAASKAALIGFTKSLALEIGSRNITVNAIAPGYIQTAMTDALADDAREKLTERIALKRLGTTDDIAYATVFLASDQASYITGTVLNVSGGLYT
jgi:3-oxoacyl-[acyl-carrier protein] reductase